MRWRTGLIFWIVFAGLAGTVSAEVLDLFPGSEGSDPQRLAVAGPRGEHLYSLARGAQDELALSLYDDNAVREIGSFGPSPLGIHPVAEFGPALIDPREMTLADNQVFLSAETALGRELVALPRADVTVPRLDLRADDRFELVVRWRLPDGDAGWGTPVRLTSDTGHFWFFRDSNVDLAIKILDGRNRNGHRWVLYGALSNVRDTDTGIERTYANQAGDFASVGDTRAFAVL